MTSNHRRSISIPQVRLTYPLPPLPLGNLAPHTPKPLYRDAPEEQPSETQDASPPTHQQQPQPPGYEPMFDYLRSQQRNQKPPPVNTDLPVYAFQSATTSQAPTGASCLPYSPTPYRDDDDDASFIVTVEASQLPPPSYNELYQQHAQEMQRLVNQFHMESPTETSEEICKWFVAMMIIALTVAAVGTAFTWGRPGCNQFLGKC